MTKLDAFMDAVYAHAGIAEDRVEVARDETVLSYCPRDMFDVVCKEISYKACNACWGREA